MTHITYQQYQDLIDHNPDMGYYYCAEGVPAKNNASSIVGFMNGDIYLCTPDEIGGKEWNELMQRQVEELIEFLDKESNGYK
jgi:hypothetical protein